MSVDTVFAVLGGVKAARLVELQSTGKTPNFESIEDNMLDAAVYPTLRLAYYRKNKMAVPPMSLAEAFQLAMHDQYEEENSPADDPGFCPSCAGACVDESPWDDEGGQAVEGYWSSIDDASIALLTLTKLEAAMQLAADEDLIFTHPVFMDIPIVGIIFTVEGGA